IVINVTYIVMENVAYRGKTAEDYLKNHAEKWEHVLDSIVKAVHHIRSISIPANSSLGSIVIDEEPANRAFATCGPGRMFKIMTKHKNMNNDKHIEEDCLTQFKAEVIIIKAYFI